MDDTRPPGERPATPSPRRWPRRLGLVALGVLALFGPWPVDNGSFHGTLYERTTLDRLGRMPGPTPPGPIRVGMAEVDLTPEKPGPLAGFSNQAGMTYAGVESACFARALTVESGPRAITILTADLLLINAELARAVLDRAGLKADEVYFSASHTHGGPGGWGRHPLERIVAGTFDPAVLEMLSNRLADVVRRSRANPVPAEVGMVQSHPSGRQKNRVVPGAPTHDALSALVFRPSGAAADTPPLAILTVFGAHATIVRGEPPRLSADYPGALVSRLKEKTGAGMVLFASGAVGDAAPERPPLPSVAKSARVLGGMLADDLLAAMPSAQFAAEVPVDRLRLDVDLPPVRLSFGSAWLRFSPAATWWIADRTTHLDALRIGPAVLIGFPGDEAGHLAGRLAVEVGPTGLTPIVTSFNGDYRGYFESGDIFLHRPCYETRWMNFYGPWLGEYLGSVASRMVGHLAQVTPAEMIQPAGFDSDPWARPLTAIALVAIALAARRDTRRGIGPVAPGAMSRLAFLVAIGFATATVIAPASVDWAKVGGLANATRLAFLIFLATQVRATWTEGRAIAHWGMFALFLASASWPIALAQMAYGLARPNPIEVAHQSK